MTQIWLTAGDFHKIFIFETDGTKYFEHLPCTNFMPAVEITEHRQEHVCSSLEAVQPNKSTDKVILLFCP